LKWLLHVASFPMLALGGCGENDLTPELASFLRRDALLPRCANGMGHLQDTRTDGRYGRVLAIELPVSTACAEYWWKSLEHDTRFKCEQGTEFRTCTRGSLIPDRENLIVMPRESDVLVVWHAGEGPVMFGPKYD
jgi:hypothetical protein